MKAILKRFLIPLFVAIICGTICGRVVYDIYDSKKDVTLTSSVVYLIQSGAYSSYDSMKASNLSNDYVYYQDDGKYKTIIGLTKKEDNINKIVDLYDGDVVINKYFITDNELDSKLIVYDNKLLIENNQDTIKNIVIEMLNYYKEKDIKLIKIS